MLRIKNNHTQSVKSYKAYNVPVLWNGLIHEQKTEKNAVVFNDVIGFERICSMCYVCMHAYHWTVKCVHHDSLFTYWILMHKLCLFGPYAQHSYWSQWAVQWPMKYSLRKLPRLVPLRAESYKKQQRQQIISSQFIKTIITHMNREKMHFI